MPRSKSSHRKPEGQLTHEIDTKGVAAIDLQSRIETFLSETRIHVPAGTLQLIKQVMLYLKTLFGQYEEELAALNKLRHKRGEFARKTMIDLGVDTPPKTIDWFIFILIIQIGFFAETGIVAFSYVSDGKMDWPSAIGTAALFALVNIALGFFAGFGGLRLALYKIKALETSALDRRTRRIGWFTFWGILTVLVFLIWMAARVRVTGHHDAVFNFDQVSFFGTFADSMSWLIIVIAALSSAVAIWKGYMIDPHRGLSVAIDYATRDIGKQADALIDSKLDIIDERVGAVLDQAYGALDDAEDIINGSANELQALNADIHHHNHEIDIAIAHIHEMRSREIQRYELTTGETLDAPKPLDVSRLEALKIDPVAETAANTASPHHIDLQALRAEAEKLEALHQTITDQIMTARAKFDATQPTLSPVTKPQGV